jgi:hypothetical protein
MSKHEWDYEHWIIAQKMIPVIDSETMKKILDFGGQVGGGWNMVHQHICVNRDNRAAIEQLLLDQGFEIVTTSDTNHPEVGK